MKPWVQGLQCNNFFFNPVYSGLYHNTIVIHTLLGHFSSCDRFCMIDLCILRPGSSRSFWESWNERSFILLSAQLLTFCVYQNRNLNYSCLNVHKYLRTSVRLGECPISNKFYSTPFCKNWCLYETVLTFLSPNENDTTSPTSSEKILGFSLILQWWDESHIQYYKPHACTWDRHTPHKSAGAGEERLVIIYLSLFHLS
jgi:hypothetical protein